MTEKPAAGKGAAEKPKSEYRGQIHKLQKDLMTRWYQRLEESALTGNPKSVSLLISGACVELLESFDVVPIYPEVNALQLAIRHESLEPILYAEQMGYASDNCAYVKADVGAMMLRVTPTGTKMPTPALALCNFVGCNVYTKWFEHLSEFQQTPLYMLDTPFMRTDSPRKEDVAYIVQQLHEIVKILEQITGKKFDIDRFRHAVQCSRQVEEMWSRIKRLAQNVPAPFDAYFDAITLMGPLYTYRANPKGVEFFEVALRELQEKVDRKEGVYDQERFRVVIEGPPPYPYFRSFRDMLSSWKAVSVASTYSTVGGLWEFGFRHDAENPFEAVALHMLEQNLCNRNMLQRYEQIRRYVEEWKADGLIIHFVKSCRLFSAGQGDMRDYFTRTLGIPTLYLESDIEDPRYFGEAQIKNRVDAYFEALGHAQATGAAVAHASSQAAGPSAQNLRVID